MAVASEIPHEELASLAVRFWHKVQKAGPDECWLWQGSLNRESYGRMKVQGRYRIASRLSYIIANGGNPKVGQVVRHRCDNPRCVNPVHLEIGSQADNLADYRLRSGAQYGGGKGKLSLELAELIRASSEPRAVLAGRYGVSVWTISAIKSYRIWLPKESTHD